MSRIKKRLRRLKRRVRLISLLMGVWRCVLMGGVYAGASALLDYLFRFPPALRVLIAVGGVGLVGWILYRYILSVLFMKIPDVELAKLVEKTHPELGESLITSVELEGSPPERELLSAIRAESEAKVSAVRFRPILNRRYLGKLTGGALCVVVAWAGYTAGFKLYVRSFFLRYAKPFSGIEYPKRTKLEVVSDSLSDHTLFVARGENLEVKVRAKPATAGSLWRPPERVYLHYRFASGSGGRKRMICAERALYTAYFPTLTEEMEFYASGDDDRTSPYRVRLVERPRLEKLRVLLRYPSYTSLPEKELPEGTGSFSAVVGTRVLVGARASKPLASASLKLKDRTIAVKLGLDGLSFSSSFILTKHDREYSFELKDREGFSSASPLVFRVTPLLDRAPRVHILYPPSVKEVTPSATVPIRIRIRDDYGVASASLLYHLGETSRAEALHLPSITTEVVLSYNWELGGLRLKSGDSVVYLVEATDKNTVTGPGVGKSTEHLLRILSPAQLLAKLQKRKESLVKTLKEVLKKQKATAEDVEHLLQKLAKEGKLEENDRALISFSLKSQKTIKSSTASSASTAERIASEIEWNRLGGPEQTQLREVADLLREASEEPMPRAIETLNKAVKSPLREVGRPLENASKAQSDALTKLKEAFERLESSRDIDSLIRATTELLSRQERIAESTRALARKLLGKSKSELSPEELGALRSLARRQKSVAGDMKVLESQMHSTAEKLEDSSPSKASIVRSALSYAVSERIRDRMSSAGSNIDTNRLLTATFDQKKAESGLRELLNRLRQARQAQVAGSRRDLINKLSDALARLDSLIAEQKSNLKNSNLESLVDSVKSADVKKLAESLEKLKSLSPRPKEFDRAFSLLRQNKLPEALKELERIRSSLGYQKDLRMRRMAELQEGTSSRTDELRSELDSLARSAKKSLPKEAEELAKIPPSLSDASRSMRNASLGLKKQSPSSAVPHQHKALDKLQQSRKALKSLVDRMTEEEQKRKLFDVAGILRKALKVQQTINSETRRIGALIELPHAEELKLKELAKSQTENTKRADRVLQHLKDEDIPTFTWLLEETVETMQGICKKLESLDASPHTQYLQKEVEDNLGELVKAFEREMRRRTQSPFGGGGGMEGGAPPLVPFSAQVKLLKILQTKIYQETKSIDLQREARGRLTRLLEKKILRLRKQEQKLAELTGRLADKLRRKK